MTLRITAYNNLPNLSAGLTARVARVVKQTAAQVVNGAKERMAEPKSGRLYGSHQASAPGEAPAIDTGNLAGSIEIEPQDAGLRAIITVGAEYGAHLEYGTVNIEPRPFLTPALEEQREGFINALAEALIP